MIQTINISLIPSDNKPVINVSQFDNVSRVLRFNVFDDADMETPHVFDDGDTVLLNIRKNDNNIVVITGVIVSDIDPETQEVTGQYLTFELTEQACACVGSNYGEVSITSGDGEVIGSCNFKLIVERSPLSGGVSSQTAIDNLTTQIEQITEQVIGENYYDKNEVDGLIDELEESIPTKTSQLQNDSGYITEDDIPTIPTKTSQLTNDSGFTTIDDSATANDKTWSSEKISDELYDLLPVGSANGAVANFNTALALPMDIEAEFGADVGGVSAVRLGYVNFNQLIENGDFESGSTGWSTTGGSTISVNNKEAVVNGSRDYFGITQRKAFIQGHKYLLTSTVKVSTLNNNIFPFFVESSYIRSDVIIPINTDYNTYSFIKECLQTGTNVLTGVRASVYNGEQIIYVKNVHIIDLTQAFGENIANYLYSLPDNGLSIAKQLFTKDYYPYNAGGSIVTLNSVNGEYTCPDENISLGSSYYNGGKVTIDKNGHRTLTADGQTVALPDGEPIMALLGDNNVYCDTGNTTVQYKDTIQNYIDTHINNVANATRSVLNVTRTLLERSDAEIERGDNNDDNAR